MTSARPVVLALVLAAGLDEAARAQAKCGIPNGIVDQLKAVHINTVQGQKKVCAAGLVAELRDDHPEHRFGPPTTPNNFPPRSLQRFSGR